MAKTGLPHRLHPIESIEELELAMMVDGETGSMTRSPEMIAWLTPFLVNHDRVGAASSRRVVS